MFFDKVNQNDKGKKLPIGERQENDFLPRRTVISKKKKGKRQG